MVRGSTTTIIVHFVSSFTSLVCPHYSVVLYHISTELVSTSNFFLSFPTHNLSFTEAYHSYTMYIYEGYLLVFYQAISHNSSCSNAYIHVNYLEHYPDVQYIHASLTCPSSYQLTIFTNTLYGNK